MGSPIINLSQVVCPVASSAGAPCFSIPDFSISEGEQVALLGKSGSGKSTLLNVLAGFLPVTSGNIQVCGQELLGLSEGERDLFRRDQVGMVFQSYQLLEDFTVLENVLMGATFSAKPLDTQIREQALGLLEQVGLHELASRRPKQLSVGQCQRVSLVRALLKKPPLLLADEPTGALDHETGEQICDLIKTLAREQNCTVLFVTHDLALASGFQQQIKVSDLMTWQGGAAL